jgi:hypothetical protein
VGRGIPGGGGGEETDSVLAAIAARSLPWGFSGDREEESKSVEDKGSFGPGQNSGCHCVKPTRLSLL